MANYTRFVSYLYEYKNGTKSENRGFIKVESRDNICKMEVHIKSPSQPANIPLTIYGFIHEQGQLPGIFLGNCYTGRGSTNCNLRFSTQNIENTKYNFQDLSGLLIFSEKSICYGTSWNDNPIMVDQFYALPPSASSENETVQTPSSEEISNERTPNEDNRKESNLNENNNSSNNPAEDNLNSGNPTISTHNQHNSGDNLNELYAAAIPEEPVATFEESAAFPEETAAKLEEPAAILEEPADFPEGPMTTPEGSITTAEEPISTSGEPAAFPERPMPTPEEPADFPMDIQPEEFIPLTNIQPAPSQNEAVPSLEPEYSIPLTPEYSAMETESAADLFELPAYTGPDAYTQPAAFTHPAQEFYINSNPAASVSDNRWMRLQQEYQAINPFPDDEIIDCIRLEQKDLPNLRRNNWLIGNNQFILHAFSNYNHLIMGRMNHTQLPVYILGVPGVYDPKEKFMANMFGFPYFKASAEHTLQQGNFGYWYRAID